MRTVGTGHSTLTHGSNPVNLDPTVHVYEKGANPCGLRSILAGEERK